MKDQLEFLDIMKLFFAHRWKIIVSAVVSGILFFLVSAFMLTPTYTSRGSLYVNNSAKETEDVSLTTLATSQQLALTCIELLSSDTFCSRVAASSKIPGLTAKDIKGMIRINAQNESQILEVHAISYSPEDSQTLVNAVLNNAQNEVDRVVKGGVVSIIDRGSYSLNPSSPNVVRNTIFGFFLGAILCMCIIFLVTRLDNRVKEEADLIKVKKLPMLGSVPNIEFGSVEEK